MTDKRDISARTGPSGPSILIIIIFFPKCLPYVFVIYTLVDS